MLLSERLGRCHQRALAAALDRAQQRVERDRGLPRADVALEQPLHRHAAREVGVDLGDRPLLVLGEGERERGAVAGDRARPARRAPARSSARARGARARCRSGARAARRTRAGAGRSPPPRATAAGAAHGARRSRNGSPSLRPRTRPEAGRARTPRAEAPPARARAAASAARPRSSDRRREVGRRARLLADVEARHVEAVAARLAAQAHDVPGASRSLSQSWLNHDARDRAAAVVDDPPSGSSARGAACASSPSARALDRHLLVAEEIGDPPMLDRRLVAARPCASRSPSVREPELLRRRRSVTPTPGSVSSVEASSSGRGRPRWPTATTRAVQAPAKPAGRRVTGQGSGQGGRSTRNPVRTDFSCP